MPDTNNSTLAQKYLIFLFLIFKNVFITSLGKQSRVETLITVSLGHNFLFPDTPSIHRYPVNLASESATF